MRDLQKYSQECMKELDAIGIQYASNIEFSINTRAKKRWGQTLKYKNCDKFIININATLLDEKNDIKGLKNTIIHELLHTCKGCMNHGCIWDNLARKVNRAYGYKIKRASSPEEKGCSESFISEQIKSAKYIIQCTKCGNKVGRERMSNVVKYPSRYTCGKCGGSVIVI